MGLLPAIVVAAFASRAATPRDSEPHSAVSRGKRAAQLCKLRHDVWKRDRPQRHEDNVQRWAPVFAGLCCPFSILLEIPGLTERWYIKTSSAGGQGHIIETRPNPALLDTGLAISMAFAVLANGALICRFLERRPRLSTLITIGALSAHDVINIVIVTVFGVVHSASDGFTYSQSFWMTVASSTASTACNITLLADFIRVDDFQVKGSGLTLKQRSLVITCMSLLCYLALGSLVFSFLIGSSLNFQDALYFTVCTISTVGFGDITPSTLSSKLFAFFYDVVGIILLAVTVAMARETIVEAFEASYRKRREAITEKAKERKNHRRQLKEAKLHQTDQETLKHQVDESGHRGSTLEHSSSPRLKYFYWTFRVQSWCTKTYGGLKRILLNQVQEKEAEQVDGFEKFKRGLLVEEHKEFLSKLIVTTSLFITFWLVGSAVFSKTEGWTYFEALYFCYVFFTTIGYGDYSVKSPAGRGFFIAWSLFGIANMTLLLSVLTEAYQSHYKYAISKKKRSRPIRRRFRKRLGRTPASDHNSNEPEIEELDHDHKVHQPRHEFEDWPNRLIEAAKGFNHHAIYWMNRKRGEPPVALKRLQQQTSNVEGLEAMKDTGGLADTATSGDVKEMLFVISYGRSFELLLESCEEASQVLKLRMKELEQLKVLTAQLRIALQRTKDPTLSVGYSDTESLKLSPSYATLKNQTGKHSTSRLDRQSLKSSRVPDLEVAERRQTSFFNESHVDEGREEDDLDDEIVEAMERCERIELGEESDMTSSSFTNHDDHDHSDDEEVEVGVDEIYSSAIEMLKRHGTREEEVEEISLHHQRTASHQNASKSVPRKLHVPHFLHPHHRRQLGERPALPSTSKSLNAPRTFEQRHLDPLPSPCPSTPNALRSSDQRQFEIVTPTTPSTAFKSAPTTPNN